MAVEDRVGGLAHHWGSDLHVRNHITDRLALVMICISDYLCLLADLRGRVTLPLAARVPPLITISPWVEIVLLAAARHVPEAISLGFHPYDLFA